MKIENDKYYTPTDLANKLISKTFHFLKNDEITDVIEPSAGNGAFSSQIPNCTAYDIIPQAEGIIEADFLSLDIPYKKGRLCIGNPPFGTRNSMSIRFYNKCCEIGDYVAFIQPISQLNNNMQMYRFELVYSEDLGVVEYSDRPLHCCFNIYRRPASGEFNSKPDYTLKDITIIEHRRLNGGYSTGRNWHVSPDYDYAICNWGNGSLGKQPKFIGEYAQEAYFYCHNKKYLPRMLELLQYDTIRKYVNSISASKISKMKLYKYLGENIEGIS